MILVTGSKESGAALWVQILVAAGHPPFAAGARADPAGPPASADPSLEHGIYFATNPHPETGRYFFPEQVADHVMAMLPFGVTRTDRAYIGKVLVTLRPVGEHVAAMRRVHALEDLVSPGAGAHRLAPALEWWAETYALVRDAATRRYPVRFVTLHHLLRAREQLVPDVVAWAGGGDPARALDTVRPEQRSFDAAGELALAPEVIAVCDELHATIDRDAPVTHSLLQKLDETHRLLLPALRAEDARVAAARRAR
jgi:hypothetical protein